MRKRSLFVGLFLVSCLVALFHGPLPAIGGSRAAVIRAVQTGSPSPTPTPSPTPSSTSSSPSPMPTPDPSYRQVSLSATRHRVRVGVRTTLLGRVRANDPGCSAASKVTIRRLIFGTNRYLNVAGLTTDANGRFNFSERVRWSSLYSAVAERRQGCARRTSDPVAVYAHVWFNVRVSDSRPKRSSNIRISGRVRPSHANTRVLLQEKRNGRWRTIQREQLSSRSSFSFYPHASWAGERLLRVRWPKGDRDHESWASRELRITTHD
jgi:hypothetical protein